MDPFSFAALAGVAFLAATSRPRPVSGSPLWRCPFFLLIMGSLSAIQVTAVIDFVISFVLVPKVLKGAPGV